MSSSSHFEPEQQPDPFQNAAPTPRRLRTPAERFGIEAEDEFKEEVAPEEDVLAPPSSPLPKRAKTRHERRRFERERARRERAVRHHAERSEAERNEAHEKSEAKPSQTSSAAKNKRTPNDPALESSALQRIKAARKRFWRRLGTFVAFFFIVQATIAALTAPQFKIKNVELSGLKATPPEKVRALVSSLVGQNAFRAPRSLVAARVAKLPTVASARVLLHPAFPPRVELKVEERQPLVRIGWNGLWWIADTKGMPFRRAKKWDTDLPRLEWNAPIEKMKALDAHSWSNAVRLLQALDAGRTSKDTSGVDAENLPSAPLPRVRTMTLGKDGQATLFLQVQSASFEANSTSNSTQSVNDETPVAANELRLRLGSDEWPEKIAQARIALAYFARTGRQAQELNFVALDCPRWTPRAAQGDLNRLSSASSSGAKKSRQQQET